MDKNYWEVPFTPKKGTSRGHSKSVDVVSMWAWLLLTLMFGILAIIPSIGPFLSIGVMIILSIIDINENIKNWSRAALLLAVIALVIVFIFF